MPHLTASELLIHTHGKKGRAICPTPIDPCLVI